MDTFTGLRRTLHDTSGDYARIRTTGKTVEQKFTEAVAMSQGEERQAIKQVADDVREVLGYYSSPTALPSTQQQVTRYNALVRRVSPDTLRLSRICQFPEG